MQSQVEAEAGEHNKHCIIDALMWSQYRDISPPSRNESGHQHLMALASELLKFVIEPTWPWCSSRQQVGLEGKWVHSIRTWASLGY